MRTTTELSQRIASLPPEQQALLALRLRRDYGAGSAVEPARDREVNEPQRLVAYVVAYPEQHVSTEQLRRYLNQQLPTYMVPSDIVFLDALPLTPNGKLDRNALPAPAPRTHDDLPAAAEPPDDVEQILAQIWADVLGLERIGLHDNFFEVGGDSILSIQIIARAHQAGFRMTPNQIFDYPTVAELAASIRAVTPLEEEPGLVAGPAPLTPIQHWFFEQQLYAPHHWNQALLLHVPADLDLSVLEQAFQQLIRHHDALRAHYRRTSQGWEQTIGGPEAAALVEHIDLAHVSAGRENEAIEQEAGRLQVDFLLERAPLLRAALFKFGSGDKDRLLIVAHHLIIDAVSWRILLEDLETLYQQLAQGNPAQLPAKTTSWQAYSTWLTSSATSSERLQAERSYWVAAVSADSMRIPLDQISADSDIDALASANTMGSERTITVALDETETHDLLYKVPGRYRARAIDLLLTALVQAFAEWTEDQSLLVGLEGHGREEVGPDAQVYADIDLSRTIGWFTTFFPVTLTAPQGSWDAALKSVKEQLRRIPNRGIGYGLLRYLSADPETRRLLAELPQPQVLFNYLGQSEAVGRASIRFQRTEGPVGPSRHLQNHRLFLLEVNSQVINGRLQMTWAYSENLHQVKTIQQLAERHRAQLRLLIAQCLAAQTAGYTPSDFPLSGLDQSELDGVLERVTNMAPTINGRIGRNAVEDLYPLSPMQGLMLLHAVTRHHQDTLLTQIRYRLEGELDIDRLRQAWQTLVDRHPALRTGFHWEQLHTPVQVVCRQVELPFVNHDLRRLPAEERQAKLETIGREDRERRFNLSAPPLMRITVVQLTDEQHELFWSSHHLILDRWCIDIVMREVVEILEAGHRSTGGGRAPAPSFRHYITWLQQQDQAATEHFWRGKLAGFIGPTQLAPNHAAPRGQGNAPEYREIGLPVPASTLTEMRRFARQHHLTLNTLLQAAWALLLGARSGEQDVSFGLTVSGRPPALAGIESMIGSFVNNLPVRILISDVEMPAWLKSIQQQMSELRQYEHSSLTLIQEWSGIARKTPLFESLLIHQAHTGFVSWRNGTVNVRNLPGQVRTSYPLTVLAAEADDKLSLSLIYDVRLFGPDLMSETGKAFVSTLEEILTQPGLTASPLSLMHRIHRQLAARSPVVDPGEQTVASLRVFGRKQNAPVAPKDILENQLVKIWEMILETENIGVQDNFFQLGGHSLLAIRLFAHIEETFGTKLPATILSQAATIQELAELMRREDAASLKPVITFQARGIGRPLFYISPPGEAMLAYAYFVHHLDLDRPCYGLQPLGLNGEQGAYTRTEAMASRFIHEIRSIQPEGPYLLTGTCFGGLVAVEVARQLQAEGQKIAFLGLLDTPFPNPTLSSKIQWHFKSLMALQPKERLDYIRERIRRRTAKMISRFYLKRQRALPAPLRDHMVRAAVAQAANTYIPQQYQGRITLFRAEGAVNQADADSVAWGWSQVATDGVDVHLVPGQHGTMMSEPHVHVLVEKFRTSLAQLEE